MDDSGGQKRPWLGLRERTRVQLALVTVQIGYGGYYVLTKAAMSSGFDRFVFAVYRELIGLALMAPVAFISERHVRIRFTVPICLYVCALGLVGIYAQQTLFLTGLSYTNTAFAAAMQNAIPVFTFLIAVLCRHEVIRLKKVDGVAKLVGILSCVTGAVTMSLFKGPVLLGKEPEPESKTVHVSHQGGFTGTLSGYGLDEWEVGSLCLVLNCLSMGVYTNLQIPALKKLPAPASLTAGSIFVGTIALVITGLLTVPDKSEWVLNQPGSIASVVYAGFVISGLTFTLQTWANHRGGPTLVAAYIPLQTVFSVFLGLVILDDPLYLGSLIGAVFILAGLYLVIWGQRTHQLARDREALVVPFDLEKPLLS